MTVDDLGFPVNFGRLLPCSYAVADVVFGLVVLFSNLTWFGFVPVGFRETPVRRAVLRVPDLVGMLLRGVVVEVADLVVAPLAAPGGDVGLLT